MQMETVEVVIKIPKEQYEYIRNGQKTFTTELCLLNGVCNGTVLPEGHGRMIDADAFNEELDNLDYDTYNDYSNTFDWIEEAPTIIEADRDNK